MSLTPDRRVVVGSGRQAAICFSVLLVAGLLVPAASASSAHLKAAHLGADAAISGAIFDGTHFYVFRAVWLPQERTAIDRYDPVTDTRVTLNVTIPGNVTAAAWTGSYALVLVRGGYNATSHPCAPRPAWDCWHFVRFTPSTQAIHHYSPAPVALLPRATAFWDGTHAYAVAAHNQSLARIQRFSPGTDTWTSLNHGLPGYRYGGATVWSGAKAYSLGWGMNGGMDMTIYASDAVGGTTQTAPRGQMALLLRSAVWMEGRLYAFGMTYVYVYDPALARMYGDTTSLPASMSSTGSAAVHSGCDAYLFGAVDPATGIQDRIIHYSARDNRTGQCSTFGYNSTSGGSHPGGNSTSANQTDWDRDNIPDAYDNCPSTPNYNQYDHDRDGYGDACDPTPYGHGYGSNSTSGSGASNSTQGNSTAHAHGNSTTHPHGNATHPAANATQPHGNSTAHSRSNGTSSPAPSTSSHPSSTSHPASATNLTSGPPHGNQTSGNSTQPTYTPSLPAPVPVAGLLALGLVVAAQRARRRLD